MKLTKEERLNFLRDALCDAGHLHYGDMRIEISDNAYEAAKNGLVNPSVEDVWVNAARKGLPIYIFDCEDETRHEIWSGSLERIDKVPLSVLGRMQDETGDCEEGDWILEFICYGEKIYG